MKTKHEQISQQRGIVLNLSRDLAPCGLHIDHEAIIRELRDMEGIASARTRSEVRGILTEIDRFYATAWTGNERPVEAPPHASTRT